MTQGQLMGLPIEQLAIISKLYGVNVDDLSYLGGIENNVYGFNRGGEECILRIGSTQHMSVSLVKAEMDWVDYLGKHAVPVAVPVPSLNGRLVETLHHLGKTYVMVCSSKLEGEHLSMRDPIGWQEDLILNWGENVGRMHRVTKDFAPSIDKRYKFNLTPDYIRRLVPQDSEEMIAKLINTFAGLGELSKDREHYGLIHSDIHVGNFFIKDDEITGFFDFDRCCYKWFVSDIAVILFYPLYVSHLKDDQAQQKAFVRRFLPLFMDGYERENRLPEGWQEQIDHFIRVRDAVLYIYCPPQFMDRRESGRIMGSTPYLSVSDEIKDLSFRS